MAKTTTSKQPPARKAGIVWGNLGRGAPGSWALVRLRDGKTLATSESRGGALRSAHALWSDLDASEILPGDGRLLRRDDEPIGAVVPADRVDAVRDGTLRGVAPAPVAAPAPAPDAPAAPATPLRAKVCGSAAPARSVGASARSEGASPRDAHVHLPAPLAAQLDALRARMTARTGCAPSWRALLVAVIEAGAPVVSARLDVGGGT